MTLSLDLIKFILYIEFFLFSEFSIGFIKIKIIKESSNFNIIEWRKLRKKKGYVLFLMNKIIYKSKHLKHKTESTCRIKK